ncbi:MAG TPA: ABC transporter substrate-binding protein [Candidatus Binatus sp.]|nr:ABC transporter substrate-binding protein [Candidatus Binatus sp.]
MLQRWHQTIKRKSSRLLGLSLVGIFLCCNAGRIEGAETAPLRKLRVAITSLSGSMAVPWLAREAGIFKKHGLEVEVIATPSGVEGMSALIAGEITFLQIAGATTVSAAVGGADVVVIGTTIDTLVLSLVVRPEIERAEQLRGKAIGITRYGTTIDTGARLALRHFNFIPEKDVSILQIGGMESIVPAMQGNRVQGGILSYPAIGRAKKLGYRELLEIPSLNFAYASTGISTRGEVIRKEPDLVRRYMMAQVEAIARMKRDRPFTINVMSKFLRTTDMEQLSEAYDIYANKYLLRVPLPTVESIRPVLEELEPRNPKAKGLDPKKFFDDRFVRELQANGFIDGLYR